MTDHHLKMFWIIENKDLSSLQQFCQQLKKNNQDVGLYFAMKTWKEIFTDKEAQQIKVYLCGVMDFSPIQHALDINWLQGAQCLCDNQIGCNIQGCGLTVINIEKFLAYCQSNPEKLV